MILVLGALALTMLLSIAAFAAINSDLPLNSNDSQQKQAYAAAQAGIQQYLFLLDQNSEYWTQCVPATNPGAINQAGSTANTRPVPGQPGETYAIELMPANGFTSCLTSNPVNSMIQASGNGAGTLRIRSTGYAGKVKRTVVANLREQSFLDYVWFTNYETSDPYVQVANAFAANGDVTLEPPSDCGSSPPKGCGTSTPRPSTVQPRNVASSAMALRPAQRAARGTTATRTTPPAPGRTEPFTSLGRRRVRRTRPIAATRSTSSQPTASRVPSIQTMNRSCAAVRRSDVPAATTSTSGPVAALATTRAAPATRTWSVRRTTRRRS